MELQFLSDELQLAITDRGETPRLDVTLQGLIMLFLIGTVIFLKKRCICLLSFPFVFWFLI